jgi:hypothetical protein
MAVVNELLIQPQSIGEMYLAAREITGPASYTTGGIALSPNLFSLLFFKILLSDHTTPDGTYFVRFTAPSGPSFGNQTATTAYMKWFVVSTGAEVASATNLSSEIIRVAAIGN